MIPPLGAVRRRGDHKGMIEVSFKDHVESCLDRLPDVHSGLSVRSGSSGLRLRD